MFNPFKQKVLTKVQFRQRVHSFQYNIYLEGEMQIGGFRS